MKIMEIPDLHKAFVIANTEETEKLVECMKLGVINT